MSSNGNETTAREPGGAGRLGAHRVARIGFGAMQLAEGHGRPAPGEQAAVAILRAAVERGVDHIDTAEFYGTATLNANDLIRTALHPYPENLAIATKVGAVRDPGGALIPAQRPEELRASVEANLTRLGAERVALVNLRRVDGRPGIVAEGDQVVDIDSQLAELVALRDEGKIDAIGLSSVTADQLRRALPVGIACVQNLYSLVDRSAEPVLDVCRENDVAWVPFFPLGSAFPGRPKVVDQPAVQSAAAALGATPAQIGLAWLLAHYQDTLLIPGTANPDHLAENLAAGDLRLDPDTLAQLDAITV